MTAAAILFRSSRPDSIETELHLWCSSTSLADCSGLLGRTPLRPEVSGERDI